MLVGMKINTNTLLHTHCVAASEKKFVFFSSPSKKAHVATIFLTILIDYRFRSDVLIEFVESFL